MTMQISQMTCLCNINTAVLTKTVNQMQKCSCVRIIMLVCTISILNLLIKNVIDMKYI